MARSCASLTGLSCQPLCVRASRRIVSSALSSSMMGFLWCGGNRNGALPSGRDSTFVSELPGGTRKQLLEIREVLFPEFQRTALICGDLRRFLTPQIYAADLAGAGLGPF